LEQIKPEEKIETAKMMTAEEIKLALFIRNKYEFYRDSLFKEEEEMRQVY
jgi:hypothetical protein